MSADRDTRRTLAQAATPGPWFSKANEVWTMEGAHHQKVATVIVDLHDMEWTIGNAAHIAANDPAQILADLDALDWAKDAIAAYDALNRAASRGQSEHMKATAAFVDAIEALRRALDGEP